MPQELERLASLDCRFIRLAALLTQHIFRLIDEIEPTDSDAFLDRI
jgi:hypothetical protein